MGSCPDSLLYDQEIHTIRIPDSIRLSRSALPPSLLGESVAFLHKDGIVALENAIDPAHLDALDSILSPEASLIAADPTHHFNFGRHTRNMDQGPPVAKALMFQDVWCNPFVGAVLSAVMGPNPTVHYANGNTALRADPGTETETGGRQPVHSDCDFTHPVYFPHAYVVNICLGDVGGENGATEVWPGTHHVSTPEAHDVSAHGGDVAEGEQLLVIRRECVEERRRHSPPVRACTRKGSLIIRDLRLWHAGMPNLTDQPRVMLAFVVQPSWWQGRSRVRLPRDVKDIVEKWERGHAGMRFAVEWVDGPVDHKKLSSEGVDFGSGNEVFGKYMDELGRWDDYVPRWY